MTDLDDLIFKDSLFLVLEENLKKIVNEVMNIE